MERNVGTISRGIRCPIIRQGDDLPSIVTESILKACETDDIKLRDKDVVASLQELRVIMHPSMRLLRMLKIN